ncbi:MAG TPA: hypothetical protein DCE34_11730 [Acinetobacter nosocomialis]|nr:hypothetical protein [Acinetobacter nosocomialis]
MKPEQFICDFGEKRAREVVEGAPSNADSFQDGYYFRANPEFQFHNGFHPVWNLTDNDGEWFKKRGFGPVQINDLKILLESIRIVEQFGGIEKAKYTSRTRDGMRYLKACIADYESIYGEEGASHG